jgi:hypothetical protein
MGLGGALTLFGTISGGLVLAANGDLQDDYGCRDGLCPRSAEDDLDRYDTLKVMSSVGIIGGLALAGTGVALFVTAPREPEDTERAHLSPWLGWGSVGVEGRF